MWCMQLVEPFSFPFVCRLSSIYWSINWELTKPTQKYFKHISKIRICCVAFESTIGRKLECKKFLNVVRWWNALLDDLIVKPQKYYQAHRYNPCIYVNTDFIVWIILCHLRGFSSCHCTCQCCNLTSTIENYCRDLIADNLKLSVYFCFTSSQISIVWIRVDTRDSAAFNGYCADLQKQNKRILTENLFSKIPLFQNPRC